MVTTRSMRLAGRANLLSLPDHVLRLVFDQECISADDITSLRLTCSALVPASSAIMFYRATLSPLCRDRDNFLRICSSPLARYVREVEWQELAWFRGCLYRSMLGKNEGWSPGTAYASRLDDEVTALTASIDDEATAFAARLDAMAKPQFWLPTLPPDLDTTGYHGRTTWEAQRSHAIDDFTPKLHDALKQLPNMTSVISQPMPNHRIAVLSDDYPIEASLFRLNQTSVGRGVQSAPLVNDGLFLFLLPAIQALKLNVTRLLWDEEHPGASFRRLTPAPFVFENLESLSLALTPQNSNEGIQQLSTSISAAKNVRHLAVRINYEDKPRHPLDAMTAVMLRLTCELAPSLVVSGWTSLQSLSITSMPIAGDNLYAIIESSEATLRHLYLEDCGVKFKQFRLLSEMPKLRLMSVRLIETVEHVDAMPVEERDLVAFVNNEPLFGRMKYRLYPELFVPNESVSLVDNVTIVTAPVFRGHFDAQKFVTPKFASDDEADDESDGVVSDSEDDFSNCATNMRPKWAWGRFFNIHRFPIVYYYRVPDSDADGHPTECWKFTNRQGHVRFGDDPLHWFEDWSEQEGDVTQPLPYCRELVAFVARGLDGDFWSYLGPDSPVSDAIVQTTPPEGAIELDEEEMNYFHSLKQ